MKTILFLMLLMPTLSMAASLILTPGQPIQAIEQTAGGYTIMDMGGKGNTLVQNVGNMEIIHHGDSPATVIIHEEPVGVPTPYNLIDMTGEE
jgi:hypothetical protein